MVTPPRPVRVGLIGAGRIGSSHAEIIARRVPGADLVAVADPRPGVAEALGASLGARGVTDIDDILAAPPDAERAIAAAHEAGVPLQVGFNRRFSADFVAAHAAIVEGVIGTPQLMRSLTRDPGLADPGGVPPWTVFTQTLIHDFDALLWLNPGATPPPTPWSRPSSSSPGSWTPQSW
jgi:myo-inositol 2-dehydrogenase/D-chiro-inositol 1-dehydrogenase